MIFRKSFARKITLSHLLIFIAISASGAFYASHMIKKEKLSDLENSLIIQARLMAGAVTPALAEEKPRRAIHEMAWELGETTDARVTIIDAQGLVLGDSSQVWEELLLIDNHAGRPEVKAALEGETGVNRRASRTARTGMLYVAIPLRHDEKLTGVLRLALTLDEVEKTLAAIQQPIFISLTAGILMMAVLGTLLGGAVSRRVQRLKSGAMKFKEGNLSRKIYPGPRDELGLLAEAMNEMAGALKSRIRDLESEKQKLSAILENMAEAVIAVDGNRRVLLVNPAAENIFCIQEKTALRRSLIEVVRNKELDDVLARAIEEQSVSRSEVSLTRAGSKTLSVNAVGISKYEGEICAILVVSDISEIRRLENLRREFVANVSHELKTPLTSIKGFVEILEGEAGNEMARRQSFLKMMGEDTSRLSRLIDDLLEISKIESGEVPLKRETLNLAAEADDALAMFHKEAEKKKITLENHIPEQPELLIHADRDRLKQVFLNLIDNAVKFSPKGGRVTLRARKTDEGIEIAVEDTGPGIPKEAVPRIFERFYRVDKARSRELGGTGLGLSIVKHIIELHGGTVSCQSTPGQGSTFSISLPA